MGEREGGDKWTRVAISQIKKPWEERLRGPIQAPIRPQVGVEEDHKEKGRNPSFNGGLVYRGGHLRDTVP